MYVDFSHIISYIKK